MEVLATTKYLRTSPRKLRLVAMALKGLSIAQAQTFLTQTQKWAAEPLAKTFKSAVSNAVHNFELVEADLRIKEIFIDSGPVYKRFQPISRGQAHEIKKRTSHITVVLEGEKKGTAK